MDCRVQRLLYSILHGLSVPQHVHNRRLKPVSFSQTTGKVGHPHQLRFQWVIVGEVVGVFSLPHVVARAAEEGYGLRVEESLFVAPMVCILAGSTANDALAVITKIDVVPYLLPAFRS